MPPKYAQAQEAQTESAPSPGEVFAEKYVVERLIGIGGMAVVVAARHKTLGELVAIKVLRQKVASPDVVARFGREARAGVTVRSEHAVRVTDVGEHPKWGPYIVMEYLEGRNFAQVLESDGALPIQDAVDAVIQCCEALAFAHAEGIVHRDIKPENIFLARRRSGGTIVKILDFGISKAALGEDIFDSNGGLEKTKTLVGSPLYMSPEQVRTLEIDGRADVWGVGVVLYELLTRRTPFQASSITEACAKILESKPEAMSMSRPDVPPGLEAIVSRCLEKDRDRRFQNVAELAIALVQFGSFRHAVLAERAASALRDSGVEVVESGVGASLSRRLSRTGEGMSTAPDAPMTTTSSSSNVPITTPPAVASQAPAPTEKKGRGVLVLGVLGLAAVALLAVFLLRRDERPHGTPAAAVTTTDTAKPGASSKVVIRSNPPGAVVEVDGAPAGTTPTIATLGAGPHTIRLTKDGKTATEVIAVRGDGADMDPAPISLDQGSAGATEAKSPDAGSPVRTGPRGGPVAAPVHAGKTEPTPAAEPPKPAEPTKVDAPAPRPTVKVIDTNSKVKVIE